MEKINTNYKRLTWKIEANFFKMSKLCVMDACSGASLSQRGYVMACAS